MNEEQDFARRNPALDQALRAQISGPKADGAFRQQVFARIAAQRAEMARLAAAPAAGLVRLRAQLVLQVLNLGAAGLVVALLLRAMWPTLVALGQSGLAAQVELGPATTSWLQSAGIVLSAAVASLYGLHRARMLDWLRGLGT
jgi:hypothetical protein